MAANNTKKLKRKVRNAYIISTTSIALVLFLLGGVGYLIMGAMGATQRLRESVTVYVMLKDGTSPERTAELKQQLTAKPNIREANYITKEAAAEEFKTFLGDDFVEFLQYNPLPNSFGITMNAHASDQKELATLEKELLTWNGVDEVVYQRNVIERVSTNVNKFNTILLLFGGTLLIISLILLNNTIRITIFAKRHIINTMKLVGATRWFITRPFLATSIWQGIYAGLIAWAMLTLMIMGLNEQLPEINFITQNIYLVAIYASLMVGGIAISLIFTAFSVWKFLRMNSSQIHIY